MASNLRSGAVARPGVRQTTRTTRTSRASASTASRAAAAGSSAQNSRLTSRLQQPSRAASPAESMMSVATTATHGTKRKERDYESESNAFETNINVVVRCRGRNEREVRENSAVVVNTEGAKGKAVELSMGPNALNNKTYNFDRVFSPASDQSMIFDDVVKPVLEEMLGGFNCTIFAYGQTGTGKTYTMSGDMNDEMGLLSDSAGIIPRVLQALFTKLEVENAESNVKCSFIELYNEELRDLIAAEEGAKLKIFDDTSRRGHSTTVVQGMVERHIHSAPDGIKVLHEGSLKRQVAATKCNDLSSRSHTVFTINVLIKRTAENGEDYLSHGKLNLVDLAGSENIQRSGAENKRAAEAGLINKSLLTLGRVINALVDRSAHIPYRESKLTRLLQDSLGGRTKTCIIATISPARSNLEETISTLDYAFRAKNIRNKPQINQMLNRNKLLNDFTQEIEKLRSELIATRQRNGVYLSNETYEDMTVQSESRRILTTEQAAKIETLESNLRNKVQELYSLTTSFMGLRKEADSTKSQLDQTVNLLDQTEIVLSATKKSLREETHLRKAHQYTEGRLVEMGGELISTLQKTVTDVSGLHAKNKRKSDLQMLNRKTWGSTQGHVSEVSQMLEDRVRELREEQESHITKMSGRMQSFVDEEVAQLSSTQEFLDAKLDMFAESKQELMEQRDRSKEEMDEVLEEIKVIRDHVKQRVGDSLQAIAGAAEKIADDVLSELGAFHGQLQESYSALGQDVRGVFDEVMKHVAGQRMEADGLRRQLEGATRVMAQSNSVVSAKIREVVNQEREQAREERDQLLSQITGLIKAQAEQQENRLAEKTSAIRETAAASTGQFEESVVQYSSAMDVWDSREVDFLAGTAQKRDTFQGKIDADWVKAERQSSAIQNTTKSVHGETIHVVDEQMGDLDTQMAALDDFVTRARSYNGKHHGQHAKTLESLSGTVEDSYESIGTHFQDTYQRVEAMGQDVDAMTQEVRTDVLDRFEEGLCAPLEDLREEIGNTDLHEYEPTGVTPEKIRYVFPTELPRTGDHEEVLLSMGMNGGVDLSPTPTVKTVTSVYSDCAEGRSPASTRPPSAGLDSQSHLAPSNARLSLGLSLREVNPNVTASSVFDPRGSTMSLAPVKELDSLGAGGVKQRSISLAASAALGNGGVVGGLKALKSGGKRHTHVQTQVQHQFEGRENVPPLAAAAAVTGGQGYGGRRKSPRLN